MHWIAHVVVTGLIALIFVAIALRVSATRTLLGV
jgi:hypothetical protein